MSKTVAVLMGGWSSEREVSLVSGSACLKALLNKGYKAHSIDVTRDMGTLMAQIKAIEPDVIFNALHGTWGEDGCIQGMLEMIGIPYTHSSPLSSALAMDKSKAKQIFAAAEIPCPEGALLPMDDVRAGKVPFAKPYVVKPNNEGSSVGVVIVREGKECDFSACGYETALVEKYIPGKELSVGVRSGRDGEPEAFTVTEIRTDREFYDYDAKYSEGGSRHIVPAEIPSDVFVRAIEYAENAHRVLGCSGATRSDFRYDENKGTSGLYLLEINNQPGMTPTSLVPEQAKYRGISFEDLVEWMVENASLHVSRG